MGKKRSEYYVQSIKKAIKILNCFSLNNKELSITEIAKMLKLHKSTIYRMMVSLEDENFVTSNLETKKYRLGIKLLELGNIVQKQIEIRKYSLPIMREIANKTKESVDLNILSGWKKISIERIDSSYPIREVIQLGKGLPIYCAASGKVIMAFLSDEMIDNIIQSQKLVPLTPKTIIDPLKLKEDLKEIQRNKYAISFEEGVLGTAAVAAPIFDYSGKVIASLSISGPVDRFTKDKISLYIPLVKEATEKISFLIGYNNS